MRRTKTFGLNLFDGSDKVRYGKINENTEKIDAALREATPTVGDIRLSANDLEAETGGRFLALDGRVINVEHDYPGLANVYDLNHRLGDAEEELAPSNGSVISFLTGTRGVRLDGNFFYMYEYDVSGSANDYNYAAVLKADGTISNRLVRCAVWLGECAGQIVVLQNDDALVAYVFESDGTQVRSVELSSSSVTVRDVRALENGGLLIVDKNGKGWYTADNFATYGACTWDGGTSAGTIPEGKLSGDVGRTIYEVDGAVYVLVKTTTSAMDTLTAWRSTNGIDFVKQWEFTPEAREAAVANGSTACAILAAVPHDGAFAVVVKYQLQIGTSVGTTGAGTYITYKHYDNICENRHIHAETGETLLTKEYPGGCGADTGFAADGALYLCGSYITSIGAVDATAPAPGLVNTVDVSVKMDLDTLEMEKAALMDGLSRDLDYYVYVEKVNCLVCTVGTQMQAVNLETGKSATLNGPQTEGEEDSGMPFLPDGGDKLYYPYDSGVAAIDLSKRKLYEMDFGYIKAK